MAHRAHASGRRLDARDAALVKGMIKRGDRHHDIAAWFGVNQGRIAEVNDETHFSAIEAAPRDELPPPGPYSSGQAAHNAIKALQEAKAALEAATANIDKALKGIR